MMGEIEIGQRFERWVVKSKGVKYLYYLCKCDCGTEKEVRKDSLLIGDSKSCGCLSREVASERQTTHGHSKHRLWNIYHDMCRRCYHPSRKDYKHYGGRGIKVCDRWYLEGNSYQGFLNFLEDMESSYEEGLEIDRYNNDREYCPKNCGWVCRRTQTNNFRHSSLVEYNGIELTCAEWGRILEVSPKIFQERVKRWGRSAKVLTTPLRNRKIVVKHKGNLYGTQELLRSKGYTQGQINGIVTTKANNCSIKALEYLGIDYELIIPKYKRIPDPIETLKEFLKSEPENRFDIDLIAKIKRKGYEI